ncbi:MAG TPA: Ig-like domain-containing protein [Beijerinckiaceae bacterium]|nr:Ig-like domain-containing protein [Beijerinckiaceae bacterium]
MRTPQKWIETDARIAVAPMHGQATIEDADHFSYVPQAGYIGKDRFSVAMDRQIRATGETAHRLMTMNVTVEKAAKQSPAARALANDPVRKCLIEVNRSHPLMQGPMRGYIEYSAYNVYQLDREKCFQSK